MNGNLIGAVNTPTLASAPGVWDIEELKLAQQQNTWPLLKQPDPDFEYVSLLLSSETAALNGAQNNTFQDSSTNNFTITRNGNTTQGSFSPYLPNWSNYFDGSGDYLTLAQATAMSFGTGDFTVEAWVYPTANPASFWSIIDARGSATAVPWAAGLRLVSGALKGTFYNGAADIQGSITVPLNTWTHVAFSRSGSTFRSFINGVLDINTTMSTVLNVTGTQFIGSIIDPAYSTGYLCDVRVVKGTAVYTSAFTPPTAPLTAIAGTSLLTCQSNRFIDNSTNNFTITRNGDTRITPFSPFSSFVATKGYVPATYGGSGYFDGTGDYLTTSATPTDLLPGTTDTTFECWVQTTSSGDMAIFSNFSVTSPFNGVEFGVNNGYQTFWSNGAWINRPTGTGLSTIKDGAFKHLAWVITNNGTTLNTYVDGVLNYTASITPSTTGKSTQSIGSDSNTTRGRYFNGYISNLRFVKGTAVYTSNFTPPTEPLTAVAGTSLLTNFTNGGVIDSAALNVAETVGNAQVSTSVKKYGSGSYYFDGTGDWCTIVDKPELRFGTGAFTVEFWLYLGVTGAARGIIGKGTGSTGWLISTNSSNNVVFTYGSSTITSTAALSGATWGHITVVRQGTGSNQTKIYINGINDGTGTVSTDFNQTNIMYVGANRTGGDALNGYISDLRLTNGVARYTTNFTPPTASLPQF